MCVGFYVGPTAIPIAAESLWKGAVYRKDGHTRVWIIGPCGESHNLSLKEALDIRAWLNGQLPSKEDETLAAKRRAEHAFLVNLDDG